MNNTSLATIVSCAPGNILAPLTTVFISVMPFHVLVFMALLRDIRLQLSRHLIMLSLSISDGLQIVVFFIVALVSAIFDLNRSDDACFVTRKAALFTGILTIFASSCTIVLLSVERYVACIHSFYVHEIMSKNRVYSILGLIWITGAACALQSVFRQQATLSLTAFGDDRVSKLIVSLTIIISSTIITIVQVRLFLFSRSKLIQVRPSRSFGKTAELADYRKCQLKVSIVASIVAIAFLVSMLPMSVAFLYESLYEVKLPLKMTGKMFTLAILNNLADPIIYGFGVRDTRRCLLKRMKTIWNKLQVPLKWGK